MIKAFHICGNLQRRRLNKLNVFVSDKRDSILNANQIWAPRIVSAIEIIPNMNPVTSFSMELLFTIRSCKYARMMRVFTVMEKEVAAIYFFVTLTTYMIFEFGLSFMGNIFK